MSLQKVVQIGSPINDCSPDPHVWRTHLVLTRFSEPCFRNAEILRRGLPSEVHNKPPYSNFYLVRQNSHAMTEASKGKTCERPKPPSGANNHGVAESSRETHFEGITGDEEFRGIRSELHTLTFEKRFVHSCLSLVSLAALERTSYHVFTPYFLRQPAGRGTGIVLSFRTR
jgi:hypothetical protein